jgi:hypothetical protein
MPRLLRIKKRLTICFVSLFFPACAQQTVLCHEWTASEKRQHYDDDFALPHDNSLHGIVRDYERVCEELK